jgi:hypothetical protein
VRRGTRTGNDTNVVVGGVGSGVVWSSVFVGVMQRCLVPGLKAARTKCSTGTRQVPCLCVCTCTPCKQQDIECSKQCYLYP